MRRALPSALVLAAVAVAPAGAEAAAPVSGRVVAAPARAGAGADYAIDLAAAEPRGAYPARLLVVLPAGARLDGRAVPVRCPHRLALLSRCPRASRIAHGRARLVQTATFSASDPGVVLTVAIGVYAGPTARPGDLGRLEVVTREAVTGIAGFASGAALPARGGGGPRLRFGLGLVQRAPEETITFRSLSLRVGARHGRVALLRNPARCRGSWAVALALSGAAPVSPLASCSTGGRAAGRESPTAGR